MNIVDIVCQKANEEKAVKINRVDLDIGELSGVMIESLEFCFEAACMNTIAKGAELKINKIKAIVFCKSCKKEFRIESDFTPCPICDDFNLPAYYGRINDIKNDGNNKVKISIFCIFSP